MSVFKSGNDELEWVGQCAESLLDQWDEETGALEPLIHAMSPKMLAKLLTLIEFIRGMRNARE